MLLSAGKSLGAGFAASSLAGAGVGIGSIFSSLLLALAKSPELKDELFVYAMLGFALTEAIALFGLLVVFIILFS
jgi:F-type H+-transporting ATPase subunit c